MLFAHEKKLFSTIFASTAQFIATEPIFFVYTRFFFHRLRLSPYLATIAPSYCTVAIRLLPVCCHWAFFYQRGATKQTLRKVNKESPYLYWSLYKSCAKCSSCRRYPCGSSATKVMKRECLSLPHATYTVCVCCESRFVGFDYRFDWFDSRSLSAVAKKEAPYHACVSTTTNMKNVSCLLLRHAHTGRERLDPNKKRPFFCPLHAETHNWHFDHLPALFHVPPL